MGRRNAFDKSQKPAPGDREQLTPPSGWEPSENKSAVIEPTFSAERTHIEGIPTADWQPKESKPDTRKRARARKLSLFQKNKQALTKRAGELKVPEHELVRYLLEYGVEQVATGQLTFEPKLSPAGLTLYPHEKQTRKTRSGYTNLKNTTCRGIPDETWQQVKALASSYPVWQVVNKLIEHGIEQLESGKLTPTPQAFNTQTLY